MPSFARATATAERALLRQVPPVPTVTHGVAGLTAARTCQWIDADPKQDATKCGVRAVTGCSWCEAHRRRAYQTDMRLVEA